jgi:hypothetical protein
MRHSAATYILLGVFIFAGVLVGTAEGKNPHRKADRGDRDATVNLSLTLFSYEQRERITQCFERNPEGLPPGLAKRETLPPGLEKHLRKNGTLPPGLQKKIQPFPSACIADLPRLPSGWVRVIITDRVILLDASKRIVDWFRIDIRIG